jgi:hypothetical protein
MQNHSRDCHRLSTVQHADGLWCCSTAALWSAAPTRTGAAEELQRLSCMQTNAALAWVAAQTLSQVGRAVSLFNPTYAW